MPIAHVQGKAGAATPVTSFSQTFGAAVQSGNCVVGGVITSTSGPYTISDDKSNTYIVVDHITAAFDNFITFILGNITNGPITITVSGSGGTTGNFDLLIDEYSGVKQITNPSDGHSATDNATVGTGAGFNSGNLTTTIANDWIWGVGYCSIGTIPGVGAGFTSRVSENAFFGALTEDKSFATPGTTNAAFTNNGASTADCPAAAIALQPVVAAAALGYAESEW
jgi:hypothetical protein